VFGSFVTQPKPVERSSEEQAAVDTQTESLSLYQFYACPFCVMVRREITRLGLNIDLRDAQTSPYRDELAKEGGSTNRSTIYLKSGINLTQISLFSQRHRDLEQAPKSRQIWRASV